MVFLLCSRTGQGIRTTYYKSSKPGAGFGSFPGGAIFTGRVCRRVCMLYIKRLPGGNSGVQWLLALIPSPRPSVCPSLSALEKTAGAHCTATTLLPFLTSHTKVYMATNVTKRLICAVCWHLVRLDDINGIPCNSHFW